MPENEAYVFCQNKLNLNSFFEIFENECKKEIKKKFEVFVSNIELKLQDNMLNFAVAIFGVQMKEEKIVLEYLDFLREIIFDVIKDKKIIKNKKEFFVYINNLFFTLEENYEDFKNELQKYIFSKEEILFLLQKI